ncbi:hypothetical protein M3O96_02530 [Aquiflexum sp. TKW24L]|nr:hypothetical protein [Aquiflexum sp. TKW24L]MCL6257949.1 hypothetical protein [Aquiflexum sp. TKW24L]
MKWGKVLILVLYSKMRMKCIYLEIFDNDVLDNMHDQVCRRVFGKA